MLASFSFSLLNLILYLSIPLFRVPSLKQLLRVNYPVCPFRLSIPLFRVPSLKLNFSCFAATHLYCLFLVIPQKQAKSHFFKRYILALKRISGNALTTGATGPPLYVCLYRLSCPLTDSIPVLLFRPSRYTFQSPLS